jgi:hypothetical protein
MCDGQLSYQIEEDRLIIDIQLELTEKTLLSLRDVDLKNKILELEGLISGGEKVALRLRILEYDIEKGIFKGEHIPGGNK